MIFILLLVLSTIAIAGSAAFFSVYGLAFTFSGTFWSVVVMGASLEAGKLIAASYLYRYWTQTRFLHKAYLMAGIVALMIMTSTGIFGYLSSGYQTDVLPLKQLDEQVQLLQSEKDRLIERKKDIDKQISQLPPNYVASRIKLMKQFQAEQKTATDRIAELDKNLLDLKTKQIQTSAHIGPITYIAKAFGVETDNATKYLIFLIIFAFDPMAVALTLAVNIAVRDREGQKQAQKQITLENKLNEFIDAQKPLDPEFQQTVDENFWNLLDAQPKEPETPPPAPIEPVKQEAPKEEVQPIVAPQPVAQPHSSGVRRHTRPYSRLWAPGRIEKINELLNYRAVLLDRQERGETLSKDELWELKAIDDVLKAQGYDEYVKS